MTYLLAALLLAITAPAYAVQASFALSLAPADNSLSPSDTTTVSLRAFNFSTETGEECTYPNDPGTCASVPATLSGTTTVVLACNDSACVSERPGTLLFTPDLMSGCVSHAPGVSACSLDGVNHLRITMSGILVPATGYYTIATFRVRAALVSGTYYMRAATGPDDLEACGEYACATAGAEGSTSFNTP